MSGNAATPGAAVNTGGASACEPPVEEATISALAMERYPLPGTVSRNAGASAESRSAWRILLIAVLIPVSTSTKTS
jgi:hypothetical protein